jgi:DNA-binding response OmpR family regulator
MRKVLIIEDHADIRRLIRMTLELEDHEIHEAATGAEGLAAARRLQPDVVLLDVMLPGGQDGISVCRELRADATLAGTSVVMLSALGAAVDRARGLEAGANAYLAKPFSPLNLIDTINNLPRPA